MTVGEAIGVLKNVVAELEKFGKDAPCELLYAWNSKYGADMFERIQKLDIVGMMEKPNQNVKIIFRKG